MAGSPSRALRAVAVIVVLCTAGATRADGAEGPPAAAPPCPAEGDVVTVLARRHELWLCQQGTAVAMFRVAIGRGGLAKRREGDDRTPIGTYALGMPRPSAQFGIFIPIGYPTVDQVAQGFTGGQVGIHGPPRGQNGADDPIAIVNWTRGCIATARDSEIARIAEFVRERKPLIQIR